MAVGGFFTSRPRPVHPPGSGRGLEEGGDVEAGRINMASCGCRGGGRSGFLPWRSALGLLLVAQLWGGPAQARIHHLILKVPSKAGRRWDEGSQPITGAARAREPVEGAASE